MGFEEISGAPVIRASKEPFERLTEFINSELSEEGEMSVERARIADIALAVGIKEEETIEELADDRVQFNLDSLDKHNVMKPIIEERHSDLEPSELRNKLQHYLEGGVQIIGEQFDEHGVFKYHEYIPEEVQGRS